MRTPDIVAYSYVEIAAEINELNRRLTWIMNNDMFADNIIISILIAHS